MDNHALEYFRQYSGKSEKGHFHQVISLHDSLDGRNWEEVSKLAPTLCRGWFELSHLPVADRIEFTREFWLTKLQYQPDLNEALDKFFSSLDEIGIFLIQQSYDDVFKPRLVYSIKNNGGFFHGHPPAHEEQIIELQKSFPDFLLPADYLNFLQIHNGFSKSYDTGIITSKDMAMTYQQFQESFQEKDAIITSKNVEINPKTLVPFYESFGMPFFQCFWSEWYPEQEMGNIYYSGETHTISEPTGSEDGLEKMAFKTFTEWLLFYLEKID